MSGTEARGRFVWYDLMTTDPDAATEFYTRLMGWGTEVWDGMGTPYTMWTTRGTVLGGVMQLPKEASDAGAPPHWMGYVAVPDVDHTFAKAIELGGAPCVQPTDIPTVGRFAVFGDPQGAMLALFTPLQQAPGHEGPPGIGEFSWHELATTDFAAAFAFYAELFGWERGEAMDMGPGGIYQLYQRGGQPLGGMFTKPAEWPGPPAWMYYLRVGDVRAAVERVAELGGSVVGGPMEVPGGDLIAHCTDPQGGFFALHSTKAG